MGFQCSIVKCAKPLVPWHFQIAVVHLEITMMHLMVECPQIQGGIVVDQQAFITRMARRRLKTLGLHVKQDVQRMGRNEEVDQN